MEERQTQKSRGKVISSYPLYTEENIVRLGQALSLAETRDKDNLGSSIAAATWEPAARFDIDNDSTSENDDEDERGDGADASDHGESSNPGVVSNLASDSEEESRDTFDMVLNESSTLPWQQQPNVPNDVSKQEKNHISSRVKTNEGERNVQLILKHLDNQSCIQFDLPEDDKSDFNKILELPSCLLSKEELLCDNMAMQCRAYHNIALAVSMKKKPVVILFIQSGRFAGAVFVNGSCVLHRTSVRYTTRKGQGKAQSAQDASQRRAVSIGAQLRRQGEVSLRQDVTTTLSEWNKEINDAILILISVPRTMQKGLFENNQNILNRADPRIRRVPLDVGRPTHENACLIHSVLLTVTVRERIVTPSSGSADVGCLTTAADVNYEEVQLSQTSPKIECESAREIISLSELHIASQNADVTAIESILESTNDDIANLINEPAGPLHMTPLHYAAESLLSTTMIVVDPEMAATCVRLLLERGHADPCCIDSRRRVPYFLASHDKIRDAFRMARAILDESYCRWDEDAKVGPALTQEAIDEKAEKEAEKRRKKRAKQKEKKALEKAEEKAAEERRLAVKEKAKIDEEAKRIRQGLLPKKGEAGACDFCQTVCVGRKRANMFKRLDFSYCSSECLQKHKRELMATAALARIGV
jgi:Bacteroidetes VLRF1 release factor/Vms1-associating treble clef domain